MNESKGGVSWWMVVSGCVVLMIALIGMLL